MAINLKKITVVLCLSFIVGMIIFIEFNDSNSTRKSQNSTDTKILNHTGPSLLMRKLKSNDLALPKKSHQLSTKTKRYIENNGADVQDFDSHQLSKLYEALGFG